MTAAEEAVPLDMDGQPITEGATVLAPFATGGAGNGARLRRMVVERIDADLTHQGYGYWTRILRLRPAEGGRLTPHNYPKNCLVVAPTASEATP